MTVPALILQVVRDAVPIRVGWRETVGATIGLHNTSYDFDCERQPKERKEYPKPASYSLAA